MKIFIKLKEDSKFNSISSSIGTFKKNIVYQIEERYFDNSIMEKVDISKKKKVPSKITEVTKPTDKTDDKAEVVEPTDDKAEVENVSSESNDEDIVEADTDEKDSIDETTEVNDIPKVKVYSKDELYALNKKEQSEIIEGYTTEEVPNKEKDRISKILQLQSEQ
jgi:hypothetical protein